METEDTNNKCNNLEIAVISMSEMSRNPNSLIPKSDASTGKNE